MATQDYYIILTTLGQAKVADAIAGGAAISLTEMAVGSAIYTPTAGQTALITEEWRAALNSLYRDPGNLNHVIAEAVVPTDVGGWEVNEVGVFDSDGDLFAIGKYPPTYKPALASGSGKDLYIRFIMEVSNDAAVTLNIDPAIVLATRNHVAQSITAHDVAADAHAKDFVMPFAGLNYPVIDTADNKIGATGAAATNGGTVSVPADVLLAVGEEVTAQSGRNRMFTTVDYTTDDLDVDTSYYLRCQVDAEGALEFYVQKGTDDDAVPAGLKGTPNGATGGGFPTTVLDMLLAKITTGAATSVPTVTNFPNTRTIVLASMAYVIEQTGLTFDKTDETLLFQALLRRFDLTGIAVRPRFIWKDADEIYIDPFVYHHHGTSKQLLYCDTQLTFPFANLAVSDWSYLYLDDSAIVTAGTNLIAAGQLIDSTIEPTWSNSKHGWYNGEDRCIFAVLTDGSSNILTFYHDGGNLVKYDSGLTALAMTDIDDIWTDVTLIIPAFSIKGTVHINGDYVDGESSMQVRTNGSSGSGFGVAILTLSLENAGGTPIVITDDTQKIEVRMSASNGNTMVVSSTGWYFSAGM